MRTRDPNQVAAELAEARTRMPIGTRVRSRFESSHLGTVVWHWSACDAGTVNALIEWDHLPVDSDGIRGRFYQRFGNVEVANAEG